MHDTRSRNSTILVAALLATAATGVLARDWLALAWNAWDYPAASVHARTQIVINGAHAYAAAGVDGIEVIDLARGVSLSMLPPRSPMDRIDDIAIADGWLFALDATPPGFLQLYRLQEDGQGKAVGAASPVPVGPFSGVAAAAGVVAVSGGTSLLSLREYDAHGRLGDALVNADFGRGQPDIALREDGTRAVIATHFYGPEFGLTLVEINRAPLRLRQLGQVRIRGAGFTRGGYKPAHFPMVAQWRGDRVYLAHGGGLSIIDASDPSRPILRATDARPRPAMDISIDGDRLYVALAGEHPAVYRYRLDPTATAMPMLVGRWPLAEGSRPAAIANSEKHSLIALHERGWRSVPFPAFAPVPPKP